MMNKPTFADLYALKQYLKEQRAIWEQIVGTPQKFAADQKANEETLEKIVWRLDKIEGIFLPKLAHELFQEFLFANL